MTDKDTDTESTVSAATAATHATTITPTLANAPTPATIASVPPPKSRAEQQMRKLKDANGKYKDLLKLAKQRIQTQEEELENCKSKCLYMFDVCIKKLQSNRGRKGEMGKRWGLFL